MIDMIELRAVAEAPVTMGVTPEVGNLVDTHLVVPGTVVRGALAAAWIREHGAPSDLPEAARRQFCELFERGPLYGPLMPEGAAIEPLSVLRCKYRPEPGCRTFACDLAAEDSQPDVCPVCGGPLEAGKGGVIGIRAVEVTRTAIDTGTGRAAEGQLFTRRALPAGTVFKGRIRGDGEWLRTIEDRPAWFGGRRTVAGRVRLTASPSTMTPPAPRDDGRIVLRLASPAVFVDDATRPLPQFSAADLSHRLGVPVTIERQWRRPIRVGGWHAAAGLPKPQEVALAAGSTAVIRPTEAVRADVLARLEHSGVGLLRREGYGAVAVNPLPWRPPLAESEAAADAADPTVALADDVLRTLEPADRRWLIDLLKERLLDIERGTASRAVDELDTSRRTRGMPVSTRDLLRSALGLSDPHAVTRLVALLEAEALDG